MKARPDMRRAPPATRPTLWRRLLLSLLAAAPVAIVLELVHGDPLWIFVASSLAIVPLAGLMGEATEALAEHMGPAVGGLLNATFGNAAELIIALVVLSRGPQMYPLVKASITGSIIGNILLVLGVSIVAGGISYKRQEFNRVSASMGATLLALASIGLVVPTLFFHIYRASTGVSAVEARDIEFLSEEIAVVLAVTYFLSLAFTLVTHRDLFSGKEASSRDSAQRPSRARRRDAVLLLLAATAGVTVLSELLVGSIEHAAETLGMSQVFIGVIVVAIIGNAAEHSTAVQMAIKNKMDLSFQIAVGSGIQIALLVAPLLVLASTFMGHGAALDLHFTPMELAALILSVGVLALVSQDGETHWMEGVMLLGVYLIFALAFYHLPPGTW